MFKRALIVILIAGAVALAVGAGPGSVSQARALPQGAGPTVEPGAGLTPSMYRLGPELLLSPSPQCDASDEHTPVVAHNYVHKENLVVWSNEWPSGSRDIYARRVSESGQVQSWFSVTTGANNRLRPAVAYNHTNDQYLVVWMQEVSSNVYEIWGRVIPWNGPGTNADFKIISWANRSFWTPRVAWNSYRNEYLVVWNAFDTSGGLPGVPSDIAGYRVSYDGVVQNPGSPSILTTYASPHQVDMVYNLAMDEYFLAFVVVHTQATTGNDIYGLRVDWNGAPDGGLIYICEVANDQNAPAVATNEQDKYMVVWEHTYSGTDHDIYGREYNVDGTPVGGYFTIASWTEDTTVPDVAANGANSEWLAVWQQDLGSGAGYAVKGFRWGSALAVQTYLFDVANWTFVEAKNPAAAGNSPGYFIAYEEQAPPGSFDIYGRTWWPEAIYLPCVLRNSH